MGQAVGTAAAMAIAHDTSPAGVLGHIQHLQQALLADDCYLPWVEQRMPALTAEARLSASRGCPEPVRDGVSRPVGGTTHAWSCRVGDWIAYSFDAPRRVSDVNLVFDSALERNITLTLHNRSDFGRGVPDVIPKGYRIDGRTGDDWEAIHRTDGNYQRAVRVPVDRSLRGIRLTLEETWGAGSTRLYAFYVS
jgi:hypothetical protein